MARSRKVQVATRTTDLQIDTGAGILLGFCFRESAGTPAAAGFVLRDGTSTAGGIIVALNLGLDESTVLWLGPQGIPYNGGLFLDIEAGELEGAVYVA